ncbi:hypothetical protein [Xylophilus ampelinus]|uniref:Uncharacterized protein n=1 Tax=Xylophilus ampelinus TaxID=54067 RepID=A0A318SLB4_9BURK|nr:hypothetical protein [Xylophilus ampelinus]MCS4509168.1 hypothetical protein [Xylophilus ampelinus]PYE79806.1 hypothetical protein DFQ15_101126 [Xylophilus ampelinus]
MATITLTLTDTPNGAVALHSSFTPAIGAALSPAQAHALDLVSRTRKQWGLHIDAAPGTITMDDIRALITPAGGAK